MVTVSVVSLRMQAARHTAIVERAMIGHPGRGVKCTVPLGSLAPRHGVPGTTIPALYRKLGGQHESNCVLEKKANANVDIPPRLLSSPRGLYQQLGPRVNKGNFLLLLQYYCVRVVPLSPSLSGPKRPLLLRLLHKGPSHRRMGQHRPVLGHESGAFRQEHIRTPHQRRLPGYLRRRGADGIMVGTLPGHKYEEKTKARSIHKISCDDSVRKNADRAATGVGDCGACGFPTKGRVGRENAAREIPRSAGTGTKKTHTHTQNNNIMNRGVPGDACVFYRYIFVVVVARKGLPVTRETRFPLRSGSPKEYIWCYSSAGRRSQHLYSLVRGTRAGVCFVARSQRRPKNPLEVWDYGTGELKETIAWNRSTAQASTGTSLFFSRKLRFFQFFVLL